MDAFPLGFKENAGRIMSSTDQSSDEENFINHPPPKEFCEEAPLFDSGVHDVWMEEHVFFFLFENMEDQMFKVGKAVECSQY